MLDWVPSDQRGNIDLHLCDEAIDDGTPPLGVRQTPGE
jgi:hypothetical protein